MVLPVFFIANMGRIIPIVVTIGTALFGFVAKNPKIIGATVSLQAISSAIQSLGATEKEKIDIVNDIGKENPQLRYDLYRNIFYPSTKYATLNTTKSKSDIFVLRECSDSFNFISE